MGRLFAYNVLTNQAQNQQEQQQEQQKHKQKAQPPINQCLTGSLDAM